MASDNLEIGSAKDGFGNDRRGEASENEDVDLF
jgi:hypothetical protein